MKYRKDFVTNSSSSSFIVSFNSADEIVNCVNNFVKNYIDDEYSHQYHDVIWDIFSKRITYEEAIELMTQYYLNEAFYKYAHIKEKLEKYNNYQEWQKSEEFKNLCNNFVSENIEKFKKNINKNSFISKLYYNDADGYYDVTKELQNMLEGHCWRIGE